MTRSGAAGRDRIERRKPGFRFGAHAQIRLVVDQNGEPAPPPPR